jgi:hypothetical protein
MLKKNNYFFSYFLNCFTTDKKTYLATQDPQNAKEEFCFSFYYLINQYTVELQK